MHILLSYPEQSSNMWDLTPLPAGRLWWPPWSWVSMTSVWKKGIPNSKPPQGHPYSVAQILLLDLNNWWRQGCGGDGCPHPWLESQQACQLLLDHWPHQWLTNIFLCSGTWPQTAAYPPTLLWSTWSLLIILIYMMWKLKQGGCTCHMLPNPFGWRI